MPYSDLSSLPSSPSFPCATVRTRKPARKPYAFLGRIHTIQTAKSPTARDRALGSLLRSLFGCTDYVSVVYLSTFLGTLHQPCPDSSTATAILAGIPVHLPLHTQQSSMLPSCSPMLPLLSP